MIHAPSVTLVAGIIVMCIAIGQSAHIRSLLATPTGHTSLVIKQGSK